ncbi:MAG: hypothetical protein H8E37_13600 [Planctomycetes bacterium]|nr:hypothetical protein [Planctomycetota bacterium]
MGFAIPGIPEIIIVLLILGAGVFFFSRRGAGSSGVTQLPGAAAGTTLNCPRCGQETAASRPTCEQCGDEL